MKTLWQHSERGNISELGADILQNWHHIRTQSADTNELYAMGRLKKKNIFRCDNIYLYYEAIK